MWWREGTERWRVFEISDAQMSQIAELITFFEFFSPVRGGLSGEALWRLHMVLRAHGHTSKTRHVFMTDVDPEGEGRLTIYKLHRTRHTTPSRTPHTEPPSACMLHAPTP